MNPAWVLSFGLHFRIETILKKLNTKAPAPLLDYSEFLAKFH